MKLVIQIPCLNEENTLPTTLSELPKHIDGIDEIEVLIIDDGSTDSTVNVAKVHGVDHIVRHPVNKGLATAFKTGLTESLRAQADIIVNTDADNQYPGRYIADLIKPILESGADIVVGDRQVQTIEHFSKNKKRLQKLGSAVVRLVSGTTVPDAPSGFRAYSREAALRLNIFTTYSYTLETIIQAGKKNLNVASVPITTNPKTRESRLMSSNIDYVRRSAATILRLFVLYEPLKTFAYVSIPFFIGGGILWLRFLLLMVMGEAARGSNVQSIIVGSVALITAVVIFMIGVVGEIVAINRQLHEETLYYQKKAAFGERQKHIDAT